MIITRYEHVALAIEALGHSLAVDIGCFTSQRTLDSLKHIDAVLVSHRHPDHFHQEHLRSLSVPVYAPPEVLELLKNDIVTRGFRLGETIMVAGIAVTPVEANHGPMVTAPIQNFGFIIEADSRRIFFTGDVAVLTPPPPGPFDLICIPVAGGGFVFDASEALEYLRAADHRGRVMPMHDSGPAEPGCIELFRAIAKDYCEVVTCNIGESLKV